MKKLLLFALLFSYLLVEVSVNNAQVATNDSTTYTKINKDSTLTVDSLYKSIYFPDKKVKPKVFRHGYEGYQMLQNKGIFSTENKFLTLVDMSLPSSQKRMWVINMKDKKVVFHNLVSHGRNSGNLFAKQFSNKPNSLMTSLGFYKTLDTYQGKHGLSLNLQGLEEGFNDNAKKRRIVIHGAEYVNQNFIKKYGRLGRSFGCPAVSYTIHKELINTIKDGSCLFIYFPDENYLQKSKYIKK